MKRIRTTRLATVATFAFGLWACGGPAPLTPAEKKVQVSTAMPTQNCEPKGDVMGEATSTNKTESVPAARDDLRRKAHAIGATHVLIETNDTELANSFMVPRFTTVLTGSSFVCK